MHGQYLRTFWNLTYFRGSACDPCKEAHRRGAQKGCRGNIDRSQTERRAHSSLCTGTSACKATLWPMVHGSSEEPKARPWTLLEEPTAGPRAAGRANSRAVGSANTQAELIGSAELWSRCTGRAYQLC